MKAGAVPYWPCGGEVLTRRLTSDGRLTARAVDAAEAARLLAFYGETEAGAALRAACATAADWRRASAPLTPAPTPPHRGEGSIASTLPLRGEGGRPKADRVGDRRR